jgi:hypothetical protein
MPTQIINNFGNVAGWNQHQVVLLGRKLSGISKIMYKDSVEVEAVYGAGGFPIGTGEGNYKAECGMTLLKEEVEALLGSLPQGSRLQDIAPTDIPVLTIRAGVVTKDVIRNFRFTGLGKEVSQNDKSVYLEMPCFCTHIDWNEA